MACNRRICLSGWQLAFTRGTVHVKGSCRGVYVVIIMMMYQSDHDELPTTRVYEKQPACVVKHIRCRDIHPEYAQTASGRGSSP
jgi:hypothetical protein